MSRKTEDYLMVIISIIMVLVLIIGSSCEQRRVENTKQYELNKDKVRLIKLEYYDNKIEICEYDNVWTQGDGESARLHIDFENRDTYIMLRDIKRYEKYIGYESEVTR